MFGLAAVRRQAARRIMPLRAKILDPAFHKPLVMNRAMSTASAEDEVKFSSHGSVRTILLNRPKKLNSLNHNMVKLILPRLLEWEKSETAQIVVLKGEGEKSLCAGGDVAALALDIAQNGEAGSKRATQYFKDEYELDHAIATFKKPFVAIQDGITMGGGVGLSMHAPFRIATEKTLFAMPETNIGFYPDVGGAFFLSRLDGHMGEYLGLTSARLKGYDAFYAGIATHYVPSNRIPDLEARLTELQGGKSTEQLYSVINSTIEEFVEDAPKDYKFLVSGANRNTVDACFEHETVEEILAALENDGSEFALHTKKTILERSPTSVKVSLAAIRRGKSVDIRQTFVNDFHLAENFSYCPDFVEGVSALLIDKPSRSPKWTPSTVQDVSHSDVAKFLSPRPNSDMTPSFVSDATYQEYPHKFGLPTEEEVKGFITGESNVKDYKSTRAETISHFMTAYKGKLGVERKVIDIINAKTKADANQDDLLDWVY